MRDASALDLKAMAQLLLSSTLLSSVVLLSASPLNAQKASPSQIIHEIHQSLASRREQLNPIWVQFTVVQEESVAWQNRRSTNAKEKRAWKAEAEYAVKGLKTRSWAKSLTPGISQLPFSFVLYNGEASVRSGNEPSVFLVSKKPDITQAVENPLSIADEERLGELLKLWAANNNHLLDVRTQQEPDTDGTPIIRLEFTSPNLKRRHRYWLCPGENFAIRRFEIKTSTGVTTAAGKSRYKEAHGIFYPEHIVASHYLVTGEFGFKTEFNLASIKTRATDIPESLFEFLIPKEATVIDSDRGITLRNTEIAQRDWDRIVQLVGPRRGFWSQWWFVLVVILLSAGSGWLWYGRSPSRLRPCRTRRT